MISESTVSDLAYWYQYYGLYIILGILKSNMALDVLYWPIFEILAGKS